jgi:hypothetical protein
MGRWVVLAGLTAVFLIGIKGYYLLQGPPAIGVRLRESAAAPAGKRTPAPKVTRVRHSRPPVQHTSPATHAPSPDEIRAGMSKEQLRAFGQPAMKTSTTEKGELIEVYMFPGKERGAATVAELRNGVVVSAYTREH